MPWIAGQSDLRGVWRYLLPAGYCPVSCPRIFCLIMSVQRFRLGFDIVIFSSDCNLQHQRNKVTSSQPNWISSLLHKWNEFSFQNEEVEIFMSCGVSPRWHGGGYFPKVLCFKSWIWLTRRYWALALGWRERLFTVDQSELRYREVSTNQAPWQSREPWYKPCDMEYNNIITSLLIPLLPLKHRMERQQEEMSSISKVWTI